MGLGHNLLQKWLMANLKELLSQKEWCAPWLNFMPDLIDSELIEMASISSRWIELILLWHLICCPRYLGKNLLIYFYQHYGFIFSWIKLLETPFFSPEILPKKYAKYMASNTHPHRRVQNSNSVWQKKTNLLTVANHEVLKL